MKCMFVLLHLILMMPMVSAQKFYSKSARVIFISEAPIEKIEGLNNSGYVILDAGSGAVEMSVLIKGFKFEKALMQDHFNENYMESSKFPKGIFKGNIINISDIDFSKDGDYTAAVKGNLTLHGVTKPFTTSAKFSIKGGAISARSSFDVTIADFDIDVPKVVRENIANTVKVSVQTDLQKM